MPANTSLKRGNDKQEHQGHDAQRHGHYRCRIKQAGFDPAPDARRFFHEIRQAFERASSAPVGTAGENAKVKWDQSVYRRSSAFELNCSGSEWLVLKCVVTGSRLGRRPAAAGWMAGALGRVRGRCGWFLLARSSEHSRDP